MLYYMSLLIFPTLIITAFVPTMARGQSVLNQTDEDKGLQSLQLSKPILQKLSDNKVYAVTLEIRTSLAIIRS